MKDKGKSDAAFFAGGKREASLMLNALTATRRGIRKLIVGLREGERKGKALGRREGRMMGRIAKAEVLLLLLLLKQKMVCGWLKSKILAMSLEAGKGVMVTSS